MFVETPDHGPQCQPVCNFSYQRIANDSENVYFISPLNDTIFEQAQGSQYYFFPFLQPNTVYTVVTDSGCSQNLHTIPYPNITNTVTSSVTCLGQPIITVMGNDPYEGNNAFFTTSFYHNGTLAFPSNSTPYNQPPNYSNLSTIQARS